MARLCARAESGHRRKVKFPMPIVVVVGGQWGDEGKGRIVDLLARKARVVARYSAGNNAGHTIVNERGEFKLHLVPAGIFYPDKTCVIGNGVAVDPEVLLDEITNLQEKGIDTSRLVVSDRAQVIMPWHKELDRLDEAMRGDAAIGTTGKGVGPCFVDKVARRGIRVADLLSNKRNRSVARPRQIAMALAKELTNHSLPEIGQMFGGRDHTTVLHACRKVKELKESDSKFLEDFSNLLRTLSN